MEAGPADRGAHWSIAVADCVHLPGLFSFLPLPFADPRSPTVPSSLAVEKQINVFLRAPDVRRLGSLRSKRDNFKA